MLCQKCQQDKASVFLTQMVGHEIKKIDLCEKCAKELGVTEGTGADLSSLLMGLAVEGEESVGEEISPGVCPSCGYTLKQLQQTGRLGCPECYRVFRRELEEAMSGMQKSMQHSGKHPHVVFSEADRRQLEEDLRKAVENEDYEKAAQLRDQLKVQGD